MKKSIAIILTIVMLIAIMPSALALEKLGSEIIGQTFDGLMVVPDMSNDMLIENCTFQNGAFLYIGDSDHEKKVTIKNCTFINKEDTGYACTIRGASEVKLIDNKVINCVRAFNIYSFGKTSVMATGNTIEITTRDIPELVKKIGIQFAGGTWSPEQTDIYGNTFTNAYMALRLHDGFKGNIDLGRNIYDKCTMPIGIDPDTEPENLDALNDALRNVTQAQDTEVTAEADPTFIVTIPASVDFGKINKHMDTQDKDFDVTISNAFIEDNAAISISAGEGPFAMKNSSGNYELEFTLSKTSFGFDLEDLINGSATQTLTASCDPSSLTAAGSYKGTITFAIGYNYAG